ncbi:hypothetical protein D3C72_871650 [compost metagenome]
MRCQEERLVGHIVALVPSGTQGAPRKALAHAESQGIFDARNFDGSVQPTVEGIDQGLIQHQIMLLTVHANDFLL